MKTVKLAIVYYSSTGTNYKLARAAEQAAEAEGADIRFRRVKELAPEEAIAGNPAWRSHLEETRNVQEAESEDLEWADAILFSIPTRYGNVPAQMKQFLDQTGALWAKGKLADKVVSAMASASNPHGGQEMTILSLYTTMYHWGAIVVPPGYTDPAFFQAGGNPYGTSATVSDKGTFTEASLNAAKRQVLRLLDVAGRLKRGTVNE